MRVIYLKRKYLKYTAVIIGIIIVLIVILKITGVI